MKLNKLLKNVDVVEIIKNENVEIENLSQNSKTKKRNQLFFAINGYTTDVRKYVLEAISNGAVAIITQTKLECDAVQVIVEDVRSAMATICLIFLTLQKDYIWLV